SLDPKNIVLISKHLNHIREQVMEDSAFSIYKHVKEAGLNHNLIRSMIRSGYLERIGRGRYKVREEPFLEQHTVAVVRMCKNISDEYAKNHRKKKKMQQQQEEVIRERQETELSQEQEERPVTTTDSPAASIPPKLAAVMSSGLDAAAKLEVVIQEYALLASENRELRADFKELVEAVELKNEYIGHLHKQISARLRSMTD
ncbi:MAG: hypothetical protein ACK5HT_05805, partial [Draconibacterium sp.]